MSSPLTQFKDWSSAKWAALGTKLGGPENAARLLQCPKVEVHFKEEDNAAIVATLPKVLKSIKLGIGANSGWELRSELLQKGIEVVGRAKELLEDKDFVVAKRETTIQLIVISVEDLGLENGGRYDDICLRINELGLMLCPAEVGPQLRLQYPEQPQDEWLTILMKPLCGDDVNYRVFVVDNRQGRKTLSTRYAYPNEAWSKGNKLVVCRLESMPAA